MGVTPTPEQQRMVGCGNPERVMAALAGKFEADEFVCGDRFTMADVYVGSHVDWGGISFGLMPTCEPFAGVCGESARAGRLPVAKEIDTALIAAQGQQK